MAKLVIPYGHPAAFEDYYASRQMAYAAGRMPNVHRPRTCRCSQYPEPTPAPGHRVAQMSRSSAAP